MSSLILTSDGKPFASFASARMLFKKRGYDEHDYGIVEVDGGGWAIEHRANKILDSTAKVVEKKADKIDDPYHSSGYHFLEISSARANELKEIPLSIDGAVILCKRGFKICLPDKYLNILRQAVEVQRTRDEDGVEIRTEIPRFPFTVIGPACREDFDSTFARAKAK